MTRSTRSRSPSLPIWYCPTAAWFATQVLLPLQVPWPRHGLGAGPQFVPAGLWLARQMPLPLQVKLLRVLQEGEVRPVGATQPIPVDVRVISATHRDLDAQKASGQFRQGQPGVFHNHRHCPAGCLKISLG